MSSPPPKKFKASVTEAGHWLPRTSAIEPSQANSIQHSDDISTRRQILLEQCSMRCIPEVLIGLELQCKVLQSILESALQGNNEAALLLGDKNLDPVG
jgi:hypothetical protein